MEKIPGMTIIRHPLLAERTTLQLGGHALAELQITNMRALESLPETAASLGGRLVVLGAGSNILAAGGELPLVLLRMRGKGEPERLPGGSGYSLVAASGSVKLPLLLGRLAAWGLSGLEGLAGIPGTVGGAMAMNAGSFGHALSDALESVMVFSASSGPKLFFPGTLELGYRHMAVKGLDEFFCIIMVMLRLKQSTPDEVRAAMRQVMARKRSTQPLREKSAGCVFKNPLPDKPAGRLLEEAGCKGMALGGMMFSTLHANFLINTGRGTAAEALELIGRAEDTVYAHHGIRLEKEVVVWA
jgi:UDP-N-acetylmuramate dehydrogenase